MPELPEVEVTRRGLAQQLTGRTISGVAVREPRLRWPVPRDVLDLAGRTVWGLTGIILRDFVRVATGFDAG